MTRHLPERRGKTIHRKSCWRKRRYPTEFRAIESMHDKEKKRNFDGDKLKVYECSVCDGFHIGHEKPLVER